METELGAAQAHPERVGRVHRRSAGLERNDPEEMKRSVKRGMGLWATSVRVVCRCGWAAWSGIWVVGCVGVLMPSLWEMPVAAGGVDRHRLHGLLASWLDTDRRADRKPWS